MHTPPEPMGWKFLDFTAKAIIMAVFLYAGGHIAAALWTFLRN